MSDNNLFCTYCNRKLTDIENCSSDYIDLNEILKLGWLVNDYGLFCSKKCYDDYIDKFGEHLNFKMKYTDYFNGSMIFGENSVIFDGSVFGFPTRSNILNVMCKKQYASECISIGNSSIVRPGTVIYEGVTIGDSFETGHGVLIRENTTIGSGVKVGSYSVIEGDVTIGDNVNIQSFVYIPKYTQIGNRVFIAPRVTFANDKYPPFAVGGLLGATVEDNVSICANATILPGVTIGEHSLVAAGAVVTKDVPPLSMAIGFPAKMVGLPEEYVKRWIDV
jgi:acetyltransferase-like isoleucine patch superfamily enzyme